MSRTIDQLFFTDLTPRDFYISKDVSTEVIDHLFDNGWKGYLQKRDLVFQAMIIGYECAKKSGDVKAFVESQIKIVKENKKETDMGQLTGFLDKERGVLALSLLLSIFEIEKVSDNINEVFFALRVLAELGLGIIKKEVIDAKISIVKKQMEIVYNLPDQIKNGEVVCSVY